MNPNILLPAIALLFAFQVTFSQEMRVVSGTLKDSNGEPLIGVNITVKGTTVGTITNMDGFYSIKAPVGSVLVFSYIGYNNREMVVTGSNSKPFTQVDEKPVFNDAPQRQSSYSPLPAPVNEEEDSTEAEEGTAVFSSQTPSYSVHNPDCQACPVSSLEVSKIQDISYDRRQVKINLREEEYLHIPHISFTSSVSVESYNRLPALQNEYSQGRPAGGVSQWNGPETGDLFSWGPAVKNLEYDGVPTPFDKNGSLVSKGYGNGKAVNPYNSASFFRNGTTLNQTLKLFENTEKKEYSFLYNNKIISGIVPDAKKTGNYLEFKFRRTTRLLKITSRLAYDQFNSRFMKNSPALGLLMSSVFTTPPTFDNSNGMISRQATGNAASYLLDNGQQRSFAAGKVNNPFWLVNNLKDSENQKALNYVAGIELRSVRNFYPFIEGSYQYQLNRNLQLYPASMLGITSPVDFDRRENLQSLKGSAGIKFDFGRDELSLNSILQYDVVKTQAQLDRDVFLFTEGSSNHVGNAPTRMEHTASWVIDLTLWDWLITKATQNIYSSSTLSNTGALYSPSLALGINLRDALDLRYPVDFFKLRGNWGFNYTEVPLNYPLGSFPYMGFTSANYQEAFYNNEVVPDFSLKPEKVDKRDLGIDLNMFRNSVSLSFDYYQNTSSNGIFPLMSQQEVRLQNVANSRTRGFDAELLLQQRITWNLESWFKFVFNHYQSKLTHLSGNLDEVPLGGFEDIHTSLIEGQPQGVIVGTAYQRNEKGEMIIGSDGYPLVDSRLHVLGDPTPDFTLGFEVALEYKRYRFNMVTEYRHGGKVWNGTENVLSYYGLSSKTIEARKVLEYVYPGVTESGLPNTLPVDFANPARPFEQNRFVRYGVTGVAEDAIQDASWFRIKELSIGYLFNRHSVKSEINLFFRNPLLVTRYKGVDPGITLWGNARTAGLDLFNMPAVSSCGVSIKINL